MFGPEVYSTCAVEAYPTIELVVHYALKVIPGGEHDGCCRTCSAPRGVARTAFSCKAMAELRKSNA